MCTVTCRPTSRLAAASIRSLPIVAGAKPKRSATGPIACARGGGISADGVQARTASTNRSGRHQSLPVIAPLLPTGLRLVDADPNVDPGGSACEKAEPPPLVDGLGPSLPRVLEMTPTSDVETAFRGLVAFDHMRTDSVAASVEEPWPWRGTLLRHYSLHAWHASGCGWLIGSCFAQVRARTNSSSRTTTVLVVGLSERGPRARVPPPTPQDRRDGTCEGIVRADERARPA